jgi:hypothetical protein
MRPEEMRKLVGGYATGTLTPEERRALLEAALADQDLFDELAREQPLKDLLEDPLARRRLLDAVDEKPTLVAWWRRPSTWALAGGLATAAVLVTVFVRPRVETPKAEPVLIAKREAAPEARELDKAIEPARSRSRFGAETEQNRYLQGAAEPDKAPSSDRKGAVEAKDAAAEMPAQPAAASAALEEEPRQFAVGALAMRSASAPAPYRILRADTDSNYVEQPPQTVFGREDRLRVAFDPPQDGHLRVTSESNLVLLDSDVRSGVPSTVDVPAGEGRLTVTFTGVAPFEILIRRE